MTILSSFKQAGRIALLGLMLSGMAMMSAPAAQAADPEPSYSINLDKYYDSSRYRIKGYDDYDYCLSDRGLLRAIADYDFEDIEFVKFVNDYKVIFLAIYDGWWYVGGADRCTGEVSYVTKFWEWEDYQYHDDDYYEPPRRRSTYSY